MPQNSLPRSAGGFGCYNTANAERAARRAQSFRPLRTKHTWDGVFMPVTLSLFGFVLFLRLPWIIGQAGLLQTLLAIGICYLVTGLMTISLAAISTNGFTGDGGPYMMVSRALGPQIGLAVGAFFVVSNLVASAMFLSGGVYALTEETTFGFLRSMADHSRYGTNVLVSTFFLALLFLCAQFKKEKLFRMLCLALTLISIVDVCGMMAFSRTPDAANGFVTTSLNRTHMNLYSDFDAGVDFRLCLTILFPATTGLMSGVSMSGELAHSAKAIPRGIGYAWALSLTVYVLITCLIASSFERASLKSDFSVLRRASGFPPIYLPGVVCACFAAVLSGLGGSSRVIQAMARDDLLPWRPVKFFNRRNPWRSVVFCAVVIQLLLMTGDIYAYATQGVTVGFCTVYFALNLSTFLTAMTGVASFRPAYNFFSKESALLGAISCVAVSFFITPLFTVIMIGLLVVVLFVADHVIDKEKVYWGDSSQPLVFHVVRYWLLRLDERKEHPRHWRPSLLYVVSDPVRNESLAHFANNCKKGGIYQVTIALRGTFAETAIACQGWKKWLLDYIAASGLKAFPVVTFGECLRVAVQYAVRGCGLGGMRPNTVLLSMDDVLGGASPLAARSTEDEQRLSANAGKFLTGREIANPVFERELLNQISAPGAGKATSPTAFGSGLLVPSSIEEFVGIAKDVASLNMTVAFGANFEMLDKERITRGPSSAVSCSPRMSPHSPTTSSQYVMSEGEEESDEEGTDDGNDGAGGGSDTGAESDSHNAASALSGPHRDSWPRAHQRDDLSGSSNSTEGKSEHPDDQQLHRSKLCRGKAFPTSEVMPPKSSVLARQLRGPPSESDDSNGRDAPSRRQENTVTFATSNAAVEVAPPVLAEGDPATTLLRRTPLLRRRRRRWVTKPHQPTRYSIDVWMEPELSTDSITALSAHCIHMTSVWRTHTDLRFITVVATEVETDNKTQELSGWLKEHRFRGSVLVLTAQSVAESREELDAFIAEDFPTYCNVMNRLARKHCGATALEIFTVPPFDGDETVSGVEWFASLAQLVTGLPPTLIMCAAAMISVDGDW